MDGSDMTTTESNKKLVSILVPALNEADNMPPLLEHVARLMAENHAYRFELIVVDDGSTDATAGALMSEDAPVPLTLVRLSRNFGSHYAISAGMVYAKGACVIVLGADLQEPPSLVTEFLERWESGAHVVWGVRESRATVGWRVELPSRLFSYLFSKYARLENYPPEGPSGVLCDRRVVDEVLRLPERNRNVLALIAWLGFRQERVHYNQRSRERGNSGWTRAKMAKLAVDSLLQFSSMPLRLCSLVGFIVAAFGISYALLLVVRAMAGVPTPSGWPTLLVVVLVLGGTQLMMTGIMGEYLWRAVEEVRQRPLYVISDVDAKEPCRSGGNR